MGVARTRTRVVLVSAITIVVGVACGIDAVGVAPIGDADGGGSSSGASSGATSSGGSSGNSADGASGGVVDAPPACTPTGPELCEDGFDNDCNGKIDCEDPACGQFACAKTEVGWTIVSVRAAGAADAGADGGADAGVCAQGWANPRELRDNVRVSGTTCGCSCGAPNGNPCANGTRSASFRNGSSACNDGTMTLNTDGSCNAVGFAWDPGNGDGNYNAVSMAAPGIVQVACAANAALPPVVDDGALIVCDLAVSPSAVACAGGVCVAAPGTDKVCLMQAGDTAACPAAFPTRKVLAPSFTDTRACGNCSCTTNATACTDTRLAFYTNAGCTQNQRTAATGACNLISGSIVPSHYRYEATANGTCNAAAPTVAVGGTLALTTPSTLCCPP